MPSFLEAWQVLASELGLELPVAERLGAELLARHREPQRHYHTDNHVEHLLQALATLCPSIPETVQLAAFFHDAVYDPRRSDNEQQSATWMLKALKPRGVALPLLQKASIIILATATHHVPEAAPTETSTFLDADLSILGSSPDRYQEYASAIRMEFQHVPEPLYREGRNKILESFLAREHIYHTEAARQKWEEAARINMENERLNLTRPDKT